MNFQSVCNTFGDILGGNGALINNTCVVNLFRDIPTTILGRKATFPTLYPAIFSFSDLDKEGRALNIGVFGLLQEEVNPVLSSLRKNGILVGSLNNHWLNDNPRVMYTHFQSIESPITFAKKVKQAMQTLEFQNFKIPSPDRNIMNSFKNICNNFSHILGDTGKVINKSCIVTLFRNIPVTIQGRKAQFPTLFPAFFSFQSIDKQGRSLNTGSVGMLQSEVNPFLTSLEKSEILVSSLETHWLFDHPRVMYMHFESIDDPILFAKKAKQALKTLKIQKFKNE